jgi:hypothetical protein
MQNIMSTATVIENEKRFEGLTYESVEFFNFGQLRPLF